MRKIFGLILSLMLVVMAAGCSSNSKPASNNSNPPAKETGKQGEAASQSTNKIKIGLAMSAQDSLFFQGERDRFEEVAKQNNVEVVPVFADGDVNKQMNQIKDLIASKVNAIVCVPVDTNSIVSSVDDAKKAGIPFIAMGRMPAKMDNVTYAVAVDNIETAKVAAEAMKEKADKAGIQKLKVIELIGDLKDQNAVERDQGFKKRAKELGIDIVSEIPTEWNPETAYSRFNDAAQAQDFNAVYVPSDMLLPSVISVLQAKGKLFPAGDKNHVIIASIDGDPNALKLIKNKQVDLTVNTDAFDFGKLAALGAIDLAKGKKTEKNKVFVPNTAISTDNVDQLGKNIWGNAYSTK